jgi:hypothetical protein
LINERLNETHWIFWTDVIINCCRQKQSLVTVAALYVLHATNIAVFIQQAASFLIGAPPMKTRVFTRSGAFLRTPTGSPRPGPLLDPGMTPLRAKRFHTVRQK